MSKHPHLHDNEVILDVRDLRVAYGKVEALHGVDLCIRRGQIVTVIGPNGAGKTTLLAALIGLLPATGDIIYMGHPRRHADEVEALVRQGMTLVPEKRELFAEMSVEDNLILGAFDRYRTGHRDQMETMDEVFELFPRLEERRSQLAGTLSGGERQMLAMGRALMARPKVLLLDEPSMGLSPIMVDKIFEVVADIHSKGTTVLLVEQNASRALGLANRGYVMDSGEITMSGDAKTLLSDPKVRAAYLGE